MSCPPAEAWIGFYGDELDGALTARMAAHLGECRACQEEFDRLSRFGAGLRGALATPPVRARGGRRRVVRPRRRSWRPLAAAAGLALSILGLVFASKTPAPGPELPPVARAVPAREAPAEVSSSVSRPPAPVLEVVPPLETPRPPEPVPAPPAEPRAEAPELPELAPAVDSAPPTPAASTRARDAAVPIATLEWTQGLLRQSQTLADGQGARGRSAVRFPDGTRMELGEKTWISRISDRAGQEGVGKSIELKEGSLAIEAAHQPAGRAMSIRTPEGEARIVGTTLRLWVEGGTTRLEVLEGKVLLSRAGGGSALVPGGHFAVLAEGVEVAARPIPKTVSETVFRFTFEDGQRPRFFDSGTVERGPERAGSRFSIAGEKVPGATAGAHVKLTEDGKPGLFTYSETLVLGFDYWTDDTVRTLDVQVWSRLQQTTFGITVGPTARSEWTHVAIPLAELSRPEPDRILHLKPGELVPNLWIQSGQVGGMIYLDNLELVRLRPPPPRKK